MPRQFRERMTVPGWWWLLAGVMVVSTTVAVGAYTDQWGGLTTFVTSSIVCAGLLVSWGRTTIVVNDWGLRVGDASLEWRYVAMARSLNSVETSRRLGVEADPQAYLAQRGYIATSVEITLDDSADPHPYWLVSTRDPEGLVAAINAHLLTDEPAEENA